jgi:hypothetical protein
MFFVSRNYLCAYNVSESHVLSPNKVKQSIGTVNESYDEQFWDRHISSPCKKSKYIESTEHINISSFQYNNPSDRARYRKLSPELRNEAMEMLAGRCSDADINELLSILTDKSEDEVMRSWGAQHIGCSWQRMTNNQIEIARNTLIAVLKSDSMTRLPQRESLFALSRLNDDKSKIAVIEYIKLHIYSCNDSELDNIVRIVGIMRLIEFKDRVLALCGHRLIQVSGAAKEAIISLESKG